MFWTSLDVENQGMLRSRPWLERTATRYPTGDGEKRRLAMSGIRFFMFLQWFMVLRGLIYVHPNKNKSPDHPLLESPFEFPMGF